MWSGGGKSSAVTCYPHCATVASRMDLVLHSVAHIYLRAACLLKCSCTKKRVLNRVENVNKDQNCDWLNFIFVHFSLENEGAYCI